ncbi:MAG: nuclear transport factor 2 family protein [Candidatus Binatia bacterium]
MRTPIEIVDAFLAAVRNGDLTDAPVASDVTFEGPRGPRESGKDALGDRLSVFAGQRRELRIREHVVEGPYVVALVEADTGESLIPASVWFRLSGGLIKEIRAFYDPRARVA